MCAALVALPALEIAIRRRCAALAVPQLVGIHCETHRAAWLAPLEAGSLENLVEAFGLCLHFHEARAGDDHRVDVAVDGLAVDHTGRRAKILNASVGA